MVELMENITSAFYQARFSSIPLDTHTVVDIENQLQKFEQTLKANRRAK